MENATFIKNNYKSSTINRIKLLFGFKNEKEINESIEVSEALKKFDVFGNNPHKTQEILFDQIEFEFSVK